MFKRNHKHKGFTILEVTVALGILTMGLLGISSLIVQNLQAQNINQNYLIASMLAQEGAELVRNKRDYNWLKFTWDKWNTGDDANYDILQAAGGGTYILDYTGAINAGVNDISVAGARLWISPGGFYDHDNTGLYTPFSRLVTVVDNGDSIEVEVDIQWQEKGRTHNYKLDFELYNWR